MYGTFTSRTLLTLLFHIFCLGLAGAQDPAFEQLDVNEGLPAKECYKVVQDKKGYIWVFTEYGIVKHDGERFVPVCTNIATSDQNAYAVFKTPKGELYFASASSKIFEIRNDSAFSIHAIEAYTRDFNGAQDVIYQLIVDKNQDIYFSTFKGAFCYKKALQKTEKLSTPYEGNTISIFHQVNGHFLPEKPFIRPQPLMNIMIYDSGRAVNSSIKNDNDFRKKALKAGGNYYLISSNWLYKVQPDGSTVSSKINNIVNFSIDDKNRIWVLTYTGIKILDLDLNLLATCLEGKPASDICFDDKNGIWVTTIGYGVFYCKNRDELLNQLYGTPYDEATFLRASGDEVFCCMIVLI